MTQQSQAVLLDMPDAARKALERLADTWERRARGRFDDYDVEGSAVRKRLIEIEAFQYLKRANELRKFLTGKLPVDFDLHDIP